MFVQTVISILPPRVYGVGFRPLLRRVTTPILSSSMRVEYPGQNLVLVPTVLCTNEPMCHRVYSTLLCIISLHRVYHLNLSPPSPSLQQHCKYDRSARDVLLISSRGEDVSQTERGCSSRELGVEVGCVLYVLYVLFVPSVRCVINKVLEGLAEGVGGGGVQACSILDWTNPRILHFPFSPFSHLSSFLWSLDNRVVFTLFCVQGFIPLPRMFFAQNPLILLFSKLVQICFDMGFPLLK